MNMKTNNDVANSDVTRNIITNRRKVLKEVRTLRKHLNYCLNYFDRARDIVEEHSPLVLFTDVEDCFDQVADAIVNSQIEECVSVLEDNAFNTANEPLKNIIEELTKNQQMFDKYEHTSNP
jgi:hypothetical protein